MNDIRVTIDLNHKASMEKVDKTKNTNKHARTYIRNHPIAQEKMSFFLSIVIYFAFAPFATPFK